MILVHAWSNANLPQHFWIQIPLTYAQFDVGVAQLKKEHGIHMFAKVFVGRLQWLSQSCKPTTQNKFAYKDRHLKYNSNKV